MGMMVVALVAVVVLAGVAFIATKDASATRYDYDATGVYTPEEGGPYVLTGEISITYTSIWKYDKVSTVSKITYLDSTSTTRYYDMGNSWDFSSHPEYGKVQEVILGYETANFGKVDVEVHSYTSDELTIKRWVGKEDGIIYRSERIYKDAIVESELRSYEPVSAISLGFALVPESLVLGVKNLR